MLLMFFGLIISGVIGLFESVIERWGILVCFQSLILGMAGNTGTQSLAVTVRWLSSGSHSGIAKWRMVGRETRTGCAEGLILGVISAVSGGAFALWRGESLRMSVTVGGCVGASLCAAMTLSSFVGTATPICFERLNIDPAVASGPLITTLGDLFSVVIYYTLAAALLNLI